jgi:hypothetical protein
MLLVIEGLLVVEPAEGPREIEAGDFLIFSSAAPLRLRQGRPGKVRFVRSVVL